MYEMDIKWYIEMEKMVVARRAKVGKVGESWESWGKLGKAGERWGKLVHGGARRLTQVNTSEHK